MQFLLTVAVAWLRTRDVSGSNFGPCSSAVLSGIFLFFLIPSRQIPI